MVPSSNSECPAHCKLRFPDGVMKKTKRSFLRFCPDTVVPAATVKGIQFQVALDLRGKTRTKPLVASPQMFPPGLAACLGLF